jgi:uncharacterized protein (DUF433 family)
LAAARPVRRAPGFDAFAALEKRILGLKWERIEVNPEALNGKPVVRGTRLAVEFIVDLLANGWTEQDILQNYPILTVAEIRACLGYASARLQAERVYPLPR